MKYKNYRYRNVNSLADMKKIIKIAKINTAIITTVDVDNDLHIGQTRYFSYLKETKKYIKFTTRYVREVEEKDGSIKYEYTGFDYHDKCVCTWIFARDGSENYHVNPGKVAKEFSTIYKPKELVEDKEDPFFESIFTKVEDKLLETAKPVLDYNRKFDNSEHYVYCYDLNSAYAAVLIDKIIDTYNPYFYCKVDKGQVGFMLDNDLTLVKPGNYADVVFNLIDSPFKEYVTKWYNIKKTTKSIKEKTEAKDRLVIGVGNWQNHNPFLRAYVVNTCNEKIMNIVNKYYDHICFWNTDAVYSDIPLDLELGNEIGQFKLEYQGLFRQKGCNYQKVDIEEVCYRGVMKSAFKKGYNLLEDHIPDVELLYKWNRELLDIEENK